MAERPRLAPFSDGTSGNGLRRIESEQNGIITMQELAKIDPVTSLQKFFSGRPETRYQIFAGAMASYKQPAPKSEKEIPQQIDDIARFAAVLDTLTYLPFVERFDLFVHRIYTIFESQRVSAPEEENSPLASGRAATMAFLHIDTDVFVNGTDIVSEPSIHKAYDTAQELFAMSTRARKKGSTFIPTESHLLLYNFLSNEATAYMEWTEIGESIQQQLGNAYPDLKYISAAGLWERLIKARNDLVAAGEVDPIQLEHRNQLSKRHTMDLLRQQLEVITPDNDKPYYFRNLPIPELTAQIGLSGEAYVARLLREIARTDGMEIKHPSWGEGSTERMRVLADIIQDQVLPKLEEEGLTWEYGSISYARLLEEILLSPRCPDFVRAPANGDIYNMRAAARSQAIREILPELNPEDMEDAIFQDMESLVRTVPITDDLDPTVKAFLLEHRNKAVVFDEGTVAYLCRRKGKAVTDFITTSLGLDKGREAEDPAFAARIKIRKVLRRKTGFTAEEETETMRRS